MKIQDASKILNITGEISPEIVKNAWKKAAMKYHPDKGGSTTMMQAVTQAYEALKDHEGKVFVDNKGMNYPDELNEAINKIIDLEGIQIEVCGAWVWVTGETKQHSKILGKNGAGFYYASKKKAWYYRPSDWKSASRGKYSLEEIRTVHGSIKPDNTKKYLRAL